MFYTIYRMLQSLLIQKLVKEYDFLQHDIKYKKAVIYHYLPELKPAYEIKNPQPEPSIQDLQTNIEEPKQTNFNDAITEEKHEPSENEKQLFRQISKVTHPDKSQEIDHNELFQEALVAYRNGDLLQLIKIAHELKIPVDIDLEAIETFKSQINALKDEDNMLSNHLVWQWYSATSDKEKEKIANIIKSI